MRRILAPAAAARGAAALTMGLLLMAPVVPAATPVSGTQMGTSGDALEVYLEENRLGDGFMICAVPLQGGSIPNEFITFDGMRRVGGVVSPEPPVAVNASYICFTGFTDPADGMVSIRATWPLDINDPGAYSPSHAVVWMAS